MGRKASLKPDVRGLYTRRIGWVEGEKYQPKFYLGRLDGPARLANARLEALWGQVEARAERLEVRAYWTEATLTLAKALAAGERVRLVTGRIITEVASANVLEEILRGPFAVVGLREAAASIEEHIAHHQAEADALCDMLAEHAGEVAEVLADFGRAPRVGQSTHEALAFYHAAVEREFTEEGQITQSGKVLLRRLEFIKRYLPDVDLGEFGTEEVEEVVRVIAKRPPAQTREKKGGQQISKKYAQKTIGAFRRMVRWWGKSKAVKWKRPDDLEFLPVKVKLNRDETVRQASPIRVVFYTVDELVTLWRYANSYERFLMTLALNCGFGQAEVAQLRTSEIHLFTGHPHASQLGLTSDSSDSWVMRGRYKTQGAYGEWRLWPITVQAIQWWRQHRPDADRPELIVKGDGSTLYKLTKGGNANQYLANQWQGVVDRVKKDKPDFRDLSFNKLRKSGTTFLTSLPSGGEAIANLFLGHGYNYTEDANLTVYVNAPWPRLHTCVRELCDHFRPVWDAVPEPFADPGLKKGGSNISVAKIGEIRALHAEGKRTGEIAKKVGVSTETVRRWVKRQ